MPSNPRYLELCELAAALDRAAVLAAELVLDARCQSPELLAVAEAAAHASRLAAEYKASVDRLAAALRPK